MLRNYLIIALRNMRQGRFYTLINLAGLTIGITSCLLIALYIQHELSYDRFHADVDRIYRVALSGKIADQEIETTSSSPPMAQAIFEEIPGIESSLRVRHYWGSSQLRYEDKVFTEQKIFLADSNFFTFFSYELTEGNPATALSKPHSIVITTSLAKKYFGDEDAMGKTLLIGNDKEPLKVTGICAPAPSNSHFKYNALISFLTEINKNPENYTAWLNNNLHTYLKKNPAVPVSQINSGLEGLVEKYVGPELEQFMGVTLDQMKERGARYGYWIYPLADTHLRSDLQHDFEPNSDMRYIYIFAAVGLIILIIACINFMNLATARAGRRAREVGLRKTMGAEKPRLIGQFLMESLLFSLLAVIISVVLTLLLVPSFNQLAGIEVGYSDLFSPYLVAGILSLTLLVGLFSGSYPAFFLTSVNIVAVLKGRLGYSLNGNVNIRRALVLLQFAISIVLITCTVFVYQQLQYLQHSNLGFDKEHILVIQNSWRLGDQRSTFKEELKQYHQVKSASFTNNQFPGVNNTTVYVIRESEQEILIGEYWTDTDHQETMQLELASGRFFSPDFPSDSNACVVNEAAVRQMGWSPEAALQKELLKGDDGGFTSYFVIGVVKDFHFESMRQEVRPLVIVPATWGSNLMVRYEGNPRDMIQLIENKWHDYTGGDPLDFEFLDEAYAAQFESEQQLGQVFTVLSAIAIFVACMGLFGLAAFAAQQRTKEIGVRKVMGATSVQIVELLTKEFTILVLIAFTLAVIPAWYLAESWLSEFAYRIELSWLVFALAGLVSLLVAWLTVSFQAVKASQADPVQSLRYE